MFQRKYNREFAPWAIPATYAAVAFAAAMTIPHIEGGIVPWFVSPVSVSSAQRIRECSIFQYFAVSGLKFLGCSHWIGCR